MLISISQSITFLGGIIYTTESGYKSGFCFSAVNWLFTRIPTVPDYALFPRQGGCLPCLLMGATLRVPF